MAQVVMCSSCEVNPAFLLVTMDPNGNNTLTVGVCLECEEGFHMMRMEQLAAILGSSPSDVTAPPEAPPAPSEAPEGPEAAEEPERPLSAFPGTQRVVRSTHGNRRPRQGAGESSEDPAEASEA
jgi:hypothetical protein